MLDPRAEYTRRLEIQQQVIAAHEKDHIRLGNAKLAVIVVGLAVLWFSFIRHTVSILWFLLPLAIYVVLTVLHQRVIQARTQAQTAVAFYQRGIARMDDRWIGTGSFGDRFRDDKHVYSRDLDVFGRGSLFELLSLARLPMGEEQLADWLRTPSRLGEILERQVLVTELRPNLDLREALAVTAEELRATKLKPAALLAWSESARVMPGTAVRVLGVVLTLAVFASAFWSFSIHSWLPTVTVLLIQGIFFRWLRSRASQVVALDCDGSSLHLFAQILQRLEQEKFTAPHLKKLVEGISADGSAASGSVRGLARLMGWMEAAQIRPTVIHILDIVAAFTIHLAFAAESWRHESGGRIRGSVEAVGEIEALLSLAGYSYEHPIDPFPQFAEFAANSVGELDGTELGHPLIPAAQCVRNSVGLGKETRLLLISGSNMSGKSTLLRTVGINVVMAMAGAPVRAKSLRLTPFILGTHMQSGDSLQEGRSNFYSEILRIRAVFELVGNELPLLFLFDELLEGTNSHDRRVGAETLLRAFVDRGAIGIVTTHDLVLTELAKSFESHARNAHFEDSVAHGKMVFDYKLKEGVVTRSNALELMRLIGLKV